MMHQFYKLNQDDFDEVFRNRAILKHEHDVTRVNLRRVTVGWYVRNDSGERENCNTKRDDYTLVIERSSLWQGVLGS